MKKARGHMFSMCAVVACGAPQPQTVTVMDTGVSDARFVDTLVDEHEDVRATDARQDADTQATAPPVHYGFLAMVETDDREGPIRTTSWIAAAFLSATPIYSNPFYPGCREEVVGACRIIDCATRLVLEGLPMGVVEMQAQATNITVLAERSSNVATLSYFSEGNAEFLSPVEGSMTILVSGSPHIANHAGGASVPPSLVVYEPTLRRTGSPVVVSRANDLVVRWAARGREERVFIRTVGAPTQFECTFPSGDGQGVVPSELLSRLPAGDLLNLSIGIQLDSDWSNGGHNLLVRVARVVAVGNNLRLE